MAVSTKKDVFVLIYEREFGQFMTEISERLETLGGSFTDAQKLSFLTELIQKRETHGRNGSNFFDDFIEAKQNAMLTVIDDMLTEEQNELQNKIDTITDYKAILAS